MRFRLRASADYVYCGLEDTVEHTFLNCPRWQLNKDELRTGIGHVSDLNQCSILTIRKMRYWKPIQRLYYLECIILEGGITKPVVDIIPQAFPGHSQKEKM